jgi:hypothetical protein
MNKNAELPTQAQFCIESGTCHVLFAYEVGFSIDLDEAERHIRNPKQRESIRRTQKAPRYFQYQPPPLRVTISAEALEICGHYTDKIVDLVIYDFGAISVIYRIPLTGSLMGLRGLGLELYDNDLLLADSRRRVTQILEAIGPAVSKLNLAEFVEDYVIYEVNPGRPTVDPDRTIADHALSLAQLLRAESEQLSQEEVDDSLACRISFSKTDVMIIDWNAAILMGTDMDDVRAVLEYANVELLEMRFLDFQLDRALTNAYTRFPRRPFGRPLRLRSRAVLLDQVARLQLDSALMFEGINNTLKLMGDPYLARVYRLASQRFHLSEWDASILRKLNTVESIYEKLSDRQSAWRMEALEWIIIILIAISIALSFK